MKSTTILLLLSILCTFSYAEGGSPEKKKNESPFLAPNINYTELVSGCETGDRTLTGVRILCNPGVPTTGGLVARIYYRKSSTSTWVSRAGTMTSGVTYDGMWSFTMVMADLGGLTTGDVVLYYIIAQSTDAAPLITSRPAGAVATDVNTVTSAPSTPSVLIVGPTLNGNYNVGTGGDYPTLRLALNAYNTSCLTGPVTFTLTDASYTENIDLTINAHPQASITNTLTIKPANGVSVTITGSSPQHWVRIIGSHVIIDGNNGTPGRNLTFNDTHPQGVPIAIFSSGSVTTENVTVKNLVTLNASNNYAGIMLADRAVPSQDGYFKNIKIENNNVRNAYYGIHANIRSGFGTDYGKFIDIINNDLSSSGAAAIRRFGIYVKGAQNCSIKNNIIGNINGSHDEDDAGIWVDGGFKNSVIEGNKISNLNYTGTAGHGAQGILVTSGISDANIAITNNFISNITGDGYEPAAYLAEPVGIMLSGSQSGITIQHNSIHLYGNTLRYTRAFSAGVYLSIGSAASIRNNIILNKLGTLPGVTPGTGAPYGATGIYVASTVAQLTQIDNNDYYIASTGVAGNYIGRIGNTSYATLTEWQTGSGGESNSKNIQPVFVSNTDLHLDPATNGLLDNLGTPVGTLTDIDSDTRSTNTPDMGADEFTAACIAPTIDVAPTIQTICSGSSLSLSVSASGTGLTYQWRKGGNPIASATSSTYSVNPANSSHAGSYDVVITGTCGNITTTPVLVTVNEAPAITQGPANQLSCVNSNVSFTVTATGTGLTYQWRKGGNPIASAIAATYTINSVAAGDAGSYDVIVSGTCAPAVTSGAATLTVNTAPAISVHPLGQTICTGGPFTFNVTATGTGLTYQWRKGGNPIALATSNSYTINPVTAADAGSYDVVVSGTCTPAVTSNAAVLALPAANSWVGAISSDWNNAANWCLGIPTSSTDISINPGTAFSPVLTTIAPIRNLTIANGATVTIGAGGWLSVFGNLTNNGTFTAASGTVDFRGTSSQTSSGFSAANVSMNCAGGVTLAGDFSVSGTLILTTGNIFLGSNNITLNNTTLGGSVTSHIITNGTGNVIMNAINVPAVTIPVGPDAASYNPVVIANGGGKNYTVNVKAGISPAILTSSLAVNRTWTILPNSTPSFNPVVTLQYADADAGSGSNGSGLMEVGVHNGSLWQIASPGINPTGTATARQVSFPMALFGPTVITNPGGISYPLAVSGLDPAVSSLQLLPNLVTRFTLLRVKSTRAMRTDWILTDMTGKIIQTFSRQMLTGTNDFSVDLGHLLPGVYQLKGITQKGTTGVVRLVKM